MTTEIFSGLRHLVSPQHLEPAFIALYAALMIAAIVITTRYLLRVPLGYALLFFPLIYSHMLHMGSYNLAIAYGLFLPLLGVCHRYIIQPTRGLGLTICFLLVLIFTTHVEMAIVSIMCVMIYASYFLGLPWLTKTCSLNRLSISRDGANDKRIIHGALLLIACAPVMGLCLLFHLQNPDIISTPTYIGVTMKAVHLGFLSGIATYTIFGMGVSALFFIMLLLASGVSLSQLIGARSKDRLHIVFGKADVMLLCFLGIFTLYAVIPDGMGDAFNVEERLMLPMLMTLLSWLALKLSPVLSSSIVAGLAASILALQTVDRVTGFYQINKSLDEFSEVSTHLPEDSAVAYVDLDNVAEHKWHRRIYKPFSVVTRFDPERHFMGEVVQDRDIVLVSNYEALPTRPYFKLKYQPWLADLVAGDDFDYIAAQHMWGRLLASFRNSSTPVDYLAVWALYPSTAQEPKAKIFLSNISQDYTLVFTSSDNHMLLYRLKK